MHMATDLVNLKRVKSLPAQIEVTEKKKGLPVPVLSMLEFFFFFFFGEREETVCGALGEINTQSQIAV